MQQIYLDSKMYRVF